VDDGVDEKVDSGDFDDELEQPATIAHDATSATTSTRARLTRVSDRVAARRRALRRSHRSRLQARRTPSRIRATPCVQDGKQPSAAHGDRGRGVYPLFTARVARSAERPPLLEARTARRAHMPARACATARRTMRPRSTGRSRLPSPSGLMALRTVRVVRPMMRQLVLHRRGRHCEGPVIDLVSALHSRSRSSDASPSSRMKVSSTQPGRSTS
jgi:hypothetical protein